jgi:hypothetical protein
VKRFFVAAILGLSLWSGASAQEVYFGVSGDAAFIIQGEDVLTNMAILSPGAQLGVRNLLGPISLRATGEYSLSPQTLAGVLEVGADLLLNFGTVLDPYLGVGAGIATFGEGGAGMGRVLAGLGPRFSPNLGLFAEAAVNAFSNDEGELFTLKARGGINFFF